jgi:hypothetical protein
VKVLRLRLLTAAVATATALIVLPAAASAAEWTPASVALPADAGGGSLAGVDCPDGYCVAVGAYYTGIDVNAQKPMVATETGGTWGAASSIQPVGAVPTQLDGVSCAAAGSCVAVGFEFEGDPFRGPKRPVAAIETAGVWGQAVQVAPPAGAAHAVLTSVSCPTAGSCVAVGGDESGPFAVSETDGIWDQAVQILPTSPGADGSPISDTIDFGAVSCAGAGSCVGVGEWWGPEGHELPSAATETAGSWGQHLTIAPPVGASEAALEGVSCPALGSCIGVGDDGSESFAVTYTDGTWAEGAVIAPPGGAPSAGLSDVSCPTSGSCVAAGDYYPTGQRAEGRPMVATEANGSWGQAIPLPTPAGAMYALLGGVSCPAEGPCEAVGAWSDPSDTELPLAYGGEPPASGSTQTGTSGPPSTTAVTSDSPAQGGATPTCSLSLKGTAIKVTRSGVAQVEVADTGGAACDGTVALSIKSKAKAKRAGRKRKKSKIRRIGGGPVKLSSGATATLSVRLNGAGKTALAKAAGNLKANLTFKADGLQIIDTVHLRGLRKKSHKHG